MAFNDYELAEHGGKPIELYEFNVGSDTYNYTSANIEYVAFGSTWVPIDGLDHSDIGQTGENKDDVSIMLPYDNEISVLFNKFILTKEITVSIFAVHESDVAQEKIHLTSGRVTARKIKFPMAELTMRSIDAEIARTVMTTSYGRDCQWAQYDGLCGLAEGDWEVVGTVTGINGFDISIDALGGQPADHFKGGMVKSTNNYRAWIRSHTAALISVDRSIPDLAVGQTVRLQPACRGDFDRCHTVFDNRANFMGAPHADVVNPFLGDGTEGDQ